MEKYLCCIVWLVINNNPCASSDIKKSFFRHLQKNKLDDLGDLKKCRVTHSGVEYEGNIAQTKTGIMCQNWETPDPLHPVAEQIVNSDFPEGSKKKAKNYCRNPRHWLGRPWCYTLDFNIPREECGVPLCSKKQCRITGPGVEYSGKAHASGSRECVFWSDIRGSEYKDILYDSLFPDGTRKSAENRCRNPDSDVGGPWCLVQAESTMERTNKYEKGYCGIPICDIKPCMAATAAVSSGYQHFHTVFSLLPLNTTSIDFSVKLWQPEDWQSGELKLALAMFPLPSTGSQMRLWKTGIEITISTYKSGITPEEDEEPDWNIEAGLLSGTLWRDLEFSWAGGFISLKVKGKPMSIFTKDFTGHLKDLSTEQFRYYSIKGSNALWNFQFCTSDNPYEEHITTHGDFERRWPLLKTAAGLETRFFVKGFHTAIIELKQAAMLQYPSIQITLTNMKKENMTTLTIKESADEERVTLAEIQVGSLLSYWEWREFLLNVDGPRLEVYWIKDSKQIKLLSAINPRIEFVKWFSIGSRQSTVHWAINCSPPPDKLKVTAELPECVMSEGEVEYSGHQSVSASGLTCVLWTDQTGVISEDLNDSNFVDGSKLSAKNYCRNPSGSDKGPYCYAADLSDSGYIVNKAYCAPRQCRSIECKMSGTGNDYVGTLGVTVTGRECQRWSATTPHAIPQVLLSTETFPELSLSNISNFCRNPSHDSAGLWCYTADPLLDTDVCHVPDCDVLGACTVIVKGKSTRQSIFILPLWKTNGLAFKVKSWDPKWTEGIRLVVGLSKENASYHLDLGAANNDKIILHYIDSNGTTILLKQKTVARVIPSGHWVGFVLILGHGEVGLKYENVPSVFFQWKYTFSQGIDPLYPKLLSYSALGDHSVGLHFPCDECHTHLTQPGVVENMYPLNWWNSESQQSNHTSLTLNIRGTGNFVIVLSKLLSVISNQVLIEVSDYGQVALKQGYNTLARFKEDGVTIFNNRSWTNFTLLLTEEKLMLMAGNITVISYVSSIPLVFYYFSLSVSDGVLFWSANCEPPNIDAPPLNGGWSSWGAWQCSVTCGGGHGKRYRYCDHPKPNLFGEPCIGASVMEGECNDFKCGDVPPELYVKIAAHTTKQAHNLRRHVGESLSVPCDQTILTELKDASPKTYLEWLKDGVPLSKQEKIGKIGINNFTIDKQNVQLNDSGVYMCVLEDRKGQRAIVQLTAVTVVTNTSTRITRKGSTIVLDCQATTLTYLFPDLTQFWILNGDLFEDYGASSHSLLDIDLLSSISKAHEGEWECVVVQVKHNLTWVTAWFKLQVKSNSTLAVTFDKLFIGLQFRPFGSNVIANSIFVLIVFVILVFIVTCAIFLLISLKRKRATVRIVKFKKDSSLAESGKEKRYEQLKSN